MGLIAPVVPSVPVRLVPPPEVVPPASGVALVPASTCAVPLSAGVCEVELPASLWPASAGPVPVLGPVPVAGPASLWTVSVVPLLVLASLWTAGPLLLPASSPPVSSPPELDPPQPAATPQRTKRQPNI